MIPASKAREYLEIVYSLKNYYTFTDLHVHPFELLFGDCNDLRAAGEGGASTAEDLGEGPPFVRDISCGASEVAGKCVSLFRNKELVQRRLARLYGYKGPTIFRRHMELSGIDSVLLLPVATENNSIDSQMKRMKDVFGDNNRFLIGWSVASTIRNSDIIASAKKAIASFDVRAVKVHPNATGINLASNLGKKRLESILETCGGLRLPLIIHGGRSPILKDPERSNYGIIGNFVDIDWSLTTSPVVIAHAGAYGCNIRAIEEEVLPSLSKLLATNDHLMVDLSGLELDALILLLTKIDQNRIVFGSDALYETQWASVVKLLEAISKVTKKIEEAFITIVSSNPSRLFCDKISLLKQVAS